MLIENPYGIAVGDSEDPELIAFPRDGIPEIIDTHSALEQAARLLLFRLQWTSSELKAFAMALRPISSSCDARTSAPS